MENEISGVNLDTFNNDLEAGFVIIWDDNKGNWGEVSFAYNKYSEEWSVDATPKDLRFVEKLIKFILNNAVNLTR